MGNDKLTDKLTVAMIIQGDGPLYALRSDGAIFLLRAKADNSREWLRVLDVPGTDPFGDEP